ncbi:MAG: CoA transferase [Pseudomonadota bacterium]
MQANKPLSGKLVLDLTQGIAGPYCGRLLAEYGARVIKVEPPGGDWVLQIGGGPGETSVNYLYYNFGKESIELDIRTPEGAAAAKKIASKADVIMESARPGVTERRGLGFEEVRKINSTIIYLSVSGYGQTGPRGPDPMTDTVGQAYSGMMSINAGMDGIPHKIHTTIIDAITGLYAFQNVSMALFGGVSDAQHIDMSLMQSSAAIMGPKVLEFAHFGHSPASPNPPAGSYPTKDGWIAVTLVRESHFVDLSNALGRPDLPVNPKFATFAHRLEHLSELVAIINGITPARTTADWVTHFRANNVLCSPINDFGMWMDDPQVVATQGAPVMEVLPNGTRSPVPRTPGREPFLAPCAGPAADTERVLAEFGLT